MPRKNTWVHVVKFPNYTIPGPSPFEHRVSDSIDCYDINWKF